MIVANICQASWWLSKIGRERRVLMLLRFEVIRENSIPIWSWYSILAEIRSSKRRMSQFWWSNSNWTTWVVRFNTRWQIINIGVHMGCLFQKTCTLHLVYLLLISLNTELKINKRWEGRGSSVPYIGLPYASQVTAKQRSFPSCVSLFLRPRNNHFVVDPHKWTLTASQAWITPLSRKWRGFLQTLTLILLTWRIWWASNNASRRDLKG